MGMREEFEAWSESHDYLGGCGLHMLDGRYRDIDLQHAWESWVAARAALVIELPETPNRGIGYGLFDAAIERVKESLASSGVSYK